jgi:hypothetical protein
MQKMLCISRYTDDTYAQHFGDERHKFYLEFRCNRPCIKDMTCCAKCAEKTSTVLQHSRKFDHGNVNEPIPDKSHIFGGNWYEQGVKKWGVPPSEIIEFALKYQKNARGEFVVEQEIHDEPTTKKRAKPKVAGNDNPVKRAKKPKIAPEQETEQTQETQKTEQTQETQKTEQTQQKKKPGPKKKEDTPYSTIINNTNKLVHKEVSLPTHLESDLDQINTDEYEIEYVRLTQFEANGTTYFRDSNKNKLYKKIKEKGIGAYVGRWNPNTDSIITDIPDSDDEE